MIFNENLVFGFIFGSAAKGQLKVKNHDRGDDLDTFICVRESDPKAKDEYLKRLTELHIKYNLKVDRQFPAEIMTLGVLKNALEGLDNFDVSIDNLVSGHEFDHLFWTHALTDKKIGIIGRHEVILDLNRIGAPHIKRWSMHIIEQLSLKKSLPEHLHKPFPGLDKELVLDKLRRLSPHQIVHLGLQYDTDETSSHTVTKA